MENFEYTGTGHQVLFGTGTLQQLPTFIKKINATRVLILSTPEQVSSTERVQSIIGEVGVAIFSQATMHTPTHITDKAVAAAQEHKADGIISIGGGSTVGLGKAISIRTGIPHLCIPTTYAGSEMTPILGETENGKKTTRRDPRILPAAVLYDVELFKSLPVGMTVYSGINAIAHAVEALYASNTNPIIQLLAAEGTRALCEALPALQADAQDPKARYQATYGAWLCGMCLGAVDMALHHKLCHTLGGTFNLPHAETHVIVLPHAIAYNAPAAPEAMAKLAAVLPESQGDAVKGINALYKKLGINISLKSLGMEEAGIDKVCDMAIASPYKNPRGLERDALRETIRRAWAGEAAAQNL